MIRGKRKDENERGVMPPMYSTAMSEEEKEEVIKEFLPLIKYTAARLAWRLPPSLTIDDLVCVGLMGLMDALEKFEQGRSKLKTYAEFRIKGAMLDELRAMDWVPRSLKKRITAVKEAHGELERELGRAPEDEEVAGAMNISLDEYYKTLSDANGSVSLRFEDFDANGGREGGTDIMECIPDVRAESPFGLVETREQKEMLARLIGELAGKEQLLLSLYYWEEMTMKEIGKVMNLTEGRVCQIHTQALIRLKAKLDAKQKAKVCTARGR